MEIDRTIKIFHIFKALLHHLNALCFTLMNEFEQENKLTFRPCGCHEPLRALVHEISHSFTSALQA